MDVVQIHVSTLAHILKIYLEHDIRGCDNREFRVHLIMCLECI
jgi:hypothetical protein